MTMKPKKKLKYEIIKKDNAEITLARTQALVTTTEKILEKSQVAKIVEFLLTHKDFFIFLISKLYPLNVHIIETYKNLFDWGSLSINEFLPWSEKLIEKYVDRWFWEDPAGWMGSLVDNPTISKKVLKKEKFIKHFIDKSGLDEIIIGSDDEWWKGLHFDWIITGIATYSIMLHNPPNISPSWRQDLNILMREYKIIKSPNVGEKIWQKIFQPILNDKIVEYILKQY